MALVKWSPSTLSPAWRPFTEFDTLRHEIDRVFNTFWPFSGSDVASTAAMWTPRVDLMEKDDEYMLHAELPGMKLEDIHIQFHEGMLTIQGERKLEHEAYILGVSPTATTRSIQRAFHTLAKQYHPDRVGPQGTSAFQDIVEAYQVLSDPERRAI